MAQEFKVGDVVQLKSGGPNMTVYAISAERKIYCTWFHDNTVKDSKFSHEILKLVNQD